MDPSRDASATRLPLAMGGGLGGIALADLLGRDGLLAGDRPRRGRRAAAAPTSTAGCITAPRSRRVIQLFMNGGVSQMDTFDYKPELDDDTARRSTRAVTSRPPPARRAT